MQEMKESTRQYAAARWFLQRARECKLRSQRYIADCGNYKLAARSRRNMERYICAAIDARHLARQHRKEGN